MKRWKLVTGVVLVFVLGVAAGSLGTGLYHKYLFSRHKADRSERKAFILERFSRDLDLTEDQKQEFKRIIDRVEDRREELFRHSHSEFAKMMDQGFVQMKKVLNPDQKKKLDELIDKFERHRKERSRRDHPGPPPRPR
jgi:Spy/CpxP family protein refolding chaperone